MYPKCNWWIHWEKNDPEPTIYPRCSHRFPGHLAPSVNLSQTSRVPPLVLSAPFMTLELINPWISERDDECPAVSPETDHEVPFRPVNGFEMLADKARPIATTSLQSEGSPLRAPDELQCLDRERLLPYIVPPAPCVSLPPDFVPLSARSQEEFLNIDASSAQGLETPKSSNLGLASSSRVSDLIPDDPGSSPTSPLTTFAGPDSSLALDLPNPLDPSRSSPYHPADQPIVSLDLAPSSEAIPIAPNILPTAPESVSPWNTEQDTELPPIEPEIVNETPCSLGMDFETLVDQTRPVATSSPEPEDPPFRVPGPSQRPDHERLQSHIVPPVPEASPHQDLTSPPSRLPEEVPDFTTSLIPDPESSKSSKSDYLDFSQVSDLVAEVTGSTSSPSRSTGFTEPEDISIPDIPKTSDSSILCLTRLEEQETASLVLPTFRDTFASISNSSCTISPPLDSRFVERTLPQLPVKSGSDREGSRRLATHFEEDLNNATPVAIVTPADPRVPHPGPLATTSALPTSHPKQRKFSPSLSKYSGRASLPQTSSSGVCCVRLPLLIIAVVSLMLALVQAIFPKISSPHLRTALTFQSENHTKDSGFVLLSIRGRQEAFHEFGVNVSHASRANGSILEACLDIQRVVRRIWQVNESDWCQSHSQIIRNERTSIPIAIAYSRVLAIHAHRLKRRFNDVWKPAWTTPYTRDKFPGPFERHQDGPRLPLLKDVPLTCYLRKMHHSFPRFFEDHDATLGDSEVSRYSRKSFTYDKSYSAMVSLPTWPLSEQSTTPHTHPHSLPLLVFLHWRSRFPCNQGWLDSKSSKGITCRVFRQQLNHNISGMAIPSTGSPSKTCFPTCNMPEASYLLPPLPEPPNNLPVC